MYRLLFIAFFLLITEYSFSQSLSYNRGGTKSTHYFEEIPYQDINGKMIVKVKINGIDYNFLFDTGAPMCLSSKILTAVNAEKLQNNQVKDVNGKNISSQTVILNDIAFGNLNFNGIPAAVGVPDFFKCWNVDGILGSNLLRNSIIQINSQKKTIVITDLVEKLQLADKKGISLFLDTIQSYPVFKVQLSGNTTMRVNFDTGDNGLLSLSETSMDQLKKAKVYETVYKGYGANQIGAFGLEKDNQKFLLKFLTFNIADIHLKNVMTVTSKGSGARLGTKMLDYGIVTIDFLKQKFYFEGNAKEIDLAEKQWPFRPTFNNNKMIVGLVWDEAGSSVSLGEQIVEVDGTSFETVDLCDLLNKKSILEGKEKSTITIRSKDGKLRKLEIEKK
ncbi:retropepsin-like aspartic protease [Pedobacter sp. GR22-10]|uniref:retropepsin-like aspartic protease n=1 Tax=Pedobacter TaxID=84567 RepID=UPI002245667F|nr:retropepsin-like aspartic protease [Pedobacter sp. GR22-10]MCX2429663.1 retropepsin-like aspartic protease [Pedobacter sp. GR22-10]